MTRTFGGCTYNTSTAVLASDQFRICKSVTREANCVRTYVTTDTTRKIENEPQMIDLPHVQSIGAHLPCLFTRRLLFYRACSKARKEIKIKKVLPSFCVQKSACKIVSRHVCIESRDACNVESARLSPSERKEPFFILEKSHESHERG